MQTAWISFLRAQGLLDMGANAPTGVADNLDFLCNIPQFQELRAMVQANPQILQVRCKPYENPRSVGDVHASLCQVKRLVLGISIRSRPKIQLVGILLKELGKQNPHLVRLIQEHQADFLRLINEPVEGGEKHMLNKFLVLLVGDLHFMLNKSHKQRKHIPSCCNMVFTLPMC